MFGYQDKTPYHLHISKENFEKHVGLLLLSNSKDSHYFLINNFKSLWQTKQSIMVKNIFIDIACNASLAQKYQKVT